VFLNRSDFRGSHRSLQPETARLQVQSLPQQFARRRTQGPHKPICRTATRRREIPPPKVRKDWPRFHSAHQYFATFPKKIKRSGFKESSMKLLNLRGEVVGRVDFEPPTSWSRTRVRRALNGFAGVAYTENQRSSRFSNVPKSYRTCGSGHWNFHFIGLDSNCQPFGSRG
jgi:hypothetical protein